MTTPDLSPAERLVVQRFDRAPTPPEVLEAAVVEEVARAMADVDDVDWDSELTLRIGTRGWYLRYAVAAVTAIRAQDGGAKEAVRRAADWLCKEYGELLDGDAEGPAGYWEFQARELLEALAPQAGDGAR